MVVLVYMYLSKKYNVLLMYVITISKKVID